MNTPAGFRLEGGVPVDIDPLRAMATPATFPETLHMTIAAYAATGLVVAGIHAFMLLRDPRNAFHRRALLVGLCVGAPAAVLQPVSGDISARYVAHWQPVKLAAMEADFTTQRDAPLQVGGLPDVSRRVTHGAIGFRTRSHSSPSTIRTPRCRVSPISRKTAGRRSRSRMSLSTSWSDSAPSWRSCRCGRSVVLRRKRDPASSRPLLWALSAIAPAGFVAIEAGWTVTEVGRQPWVVYGIMRTADAVTPMPGLIVPFLTFTLLYCFLGAIVAYLLYQQVLKSPGITEPHVDTGLAA